MSDSKSCEMPDCNPDDDLISDILNKYKTIAIVGISDNPERDSFRVADYLNDNGYNIIPVNPLKDEILGRKCFPDLKSITETVDIVDIFRRVDAIPAIVDEAITIKAKVVWMQLGLAHNEAADKARNSGIQVVQSKCIKIEHSKLQKF